MWQFVTSGHGTCCSARHCSSSSSSPSVFWVGSFLFLWHARGSTDVHLDLSTNLTQRSLDQGWSLSFESSKWAANILLCHPALVVNGPCIVCSSEGYKRSALLQSLSIQSLNCTHTFILADLFVISLNIQGIPAEFPIFPWRPSNYWINDGGWVGKCIDVYFFMCRLLMIYLPDDVIDPPHFYITHSEAHHTLLHYTELTERLRRKASYQWPASTNTAPRPPGRLSAICCTGTSGRARISCCTSYSRTTAIVKNARVTSVTSGGIVELTIILM